MKTIKSVYETPKPQQRIKSKAHNVFTGQISKIALSNNSDERLQTFDNITSYPYAANVGKVCKIDLLNVVPCKI